jgi:hypothetical protein
MDFIAGLIIGGILGGAIGLYIGACAIYMGARVLGWLRSTIGDTKKYG